MTDPHETTNRAAPVRLELVNTATEETGPRLERVNIMASTEMLAWLDSVSSRMARKSGVKVSRSEILRGIVGAFADKNPQFTGCHSEAHIRIVVGRLFDIYAQHAKANPPAPRPPQAPQATSASELDEYLKSRRYASANATGAHLTSPATVRRAQ